MKEEVSRILKMVEEGKIDSSKAAELIEALNNPTEVVPVNNYQDKMLKIRVLSSENDKVNVTLPIKLIKAVGSAVEKMPQVAGVAGVEGLDIKVILDAIDSGLEGKIVDVQSGNGDIVEVVIE